MSWVDELRDAMAEAGLSPSVPLAIDGRLHRYDVEGDRRGSRAGWYVVHGDDRPAAAFGSWRSGESHTWHVGSDDRRSLLSASEREAIRVERERRRAEGCAAQEQAAHRAGEIWARCLDTDPTHPYLTAKGVAAYGLRQYSRQSRDLLVVPLRDARGRLWSLQFINPNGEKRFLRGGRVRGLFHVIGWPTSRTWLVEGYATGISVHECFGERVVCAMNAGNLLPVGQAIVKAWQPSSLAIMADDDWRTPGNPGVTKASEAADALGCDWFLPEFPANRPDWATDFNDAARLAREVRRDRAS